MNSNGQSRLGSRICARWLEAIREVIRPSSPVYRIAFAVVILAGSDQLSFTQESLTPPPDDPNVFMMFLDFHENLRHALTRQSTTGDQGAAQNLESAWPERLHLSPAGSAAVSLAYSTLVVVLNRQRS